MKKVYQFCKKKENQNFQKKSKFPKFPKISKFPKKSKFPKIIKISKNNQNFQKKSKFPNLQNIGERVLGGLNQADHSKQAQVKGFLFPYENFFC